MLKVVVTNVYNDDNRGGAALTRATIEAVRRAFGACEIVLVSVDGSDCDPYRHTMRRFPDVSLVDPLVGSRKGRIGGLVSMLASLPLYFFPWFTGNPLVAHIRSADLVVGKGGQVFSGHRRKGLLVGFWLVCLPLLVANRLGRPTAMYSVSIGPYGRNRLASRLAAFVLRRIDLLIVRDGVSQTEAVCLGVPPERILVVPDAVLGLPMPNPRRTAEVMQRLGVAGPRFGVVTVQKGMLRGRRLAVVADGLSRVLEDGTVDELLVVLQTDGLTTSDREASEQLTSRMDSDRVRLVASDLSVSDLIALYRGAQFVLGGRIHSALFALVAGAPGLPVSVSPRSKAVNMFEYLGLNELIIELEGRHRDPESLAAAVKAAAEGRTELGDRIESVIAAARAGGEMAIAGLRSLVRNGKVTPGVPREPSVGGRR